MAKIALGKRPKNFKSVVRFPMLDGTEGAIEVSYIYRTRTEFGALIDSLLAEAGVQASGSDAESQSLSMKAALERTKDTNADYIMRVADGWNLEDPFTLENVAQLCDEIPAAAMAIMNGYRDAVTEGRLGN